MKGIPGDFRKSLFPFLSSFSPLFLLLTIKNFNYGEFFNFFRILQSQYQKELTWLSVVIKAFDCWSGNMAGSIYWFLNVALLLYSIRATYWLKGQLDDAEKKRGCPMTLSQTMQIKNYDILTYLMTYLLALITWEPGSIGDTIVNILILSFLYLFYSKQSMWTFNIFIILWGFNLYEGGENIIITKIPLKTLLKRQQHQAPLRRISLFGNVILINERKRN